MNPIICLLTDFGNKDAYTGILKGVLLTLQPECRIVDLCHNIPPFNAYSAAYSLYSAFDYFPENTLFLCVIDPGVGTERPIIIAELDNKILIAPDTGIFSLLIRMKGLNGVKAVTPGFLEKIRRGKSATFQGRDVFAPLAAHIAASGVNKTDTKTVEPVLLDKVWPSIDEKNRAITGSVIHIDRFGNAITSIHRKDAEKLVLSPPLEIKAGSICINGIDKTYQNVAKGEGLCYWGSSDFLEIGAREENAEKKFEITPLSEVQLKCH
ncbi:MAG: SAM-dependent chlorinase/fluorinase [Spirochaetales bacterium]|nr:SAM-dependent chlorinase/fluorinase [Spirochaetales bacterium]